MKRVVKLFGETWKQNESMCGKHGVVVSRLEFPKGSAAR